MTLDTLKPIESTSKEDIIWWVETLTLGGLLTFLLIERHKKTPLSVWIATGAATALLFVLQHKRWKKLGWI